MENTKLAIILMLIGATAAHSGKKDKKTNVLQEITNKPFEKKIPCCGCMKAVPRNI